MPPKGRGDAWRKHEEQEARRRFQEIEDARKEETKPRRALLFGSFAFRNAVNATEADLHASADGPSLSATEKEHLLFRVGAPAVGIAVAAEADLVAGTYHSDDEDDEEVAAVAVAEGDCLR